MPMKEIALTPDTLPRECTGSIWNLVCSNLGNRSCVPWDERFIISISRNMPRNNRQ